MTMFVNLEILQICENIDSKCLLKSSLFDILYQLSQNSVLQFFKKQPYLYFLERVGHHGDQHIDKHDDCHPVVRHKK